MSEACRLVLNHNSLHVDPSLSLKKRKEIQEDEEENPDWAKLTMLQPPSQEQPMKRQERPVSSLSGSVPQHRTREIPLKSASIPKKKTCSAFKFLEL